MEVLTFYIVAGAVYLFSLAVKRTLLATYASWNAVPNASGLRGERVARRILDTKQLQSVSVSQVAGCLTDHYDPRNKSISLSNSNFSSQSVAAMAVAAHECGHALQDAEGYLPMKLRGAAIPVANAGSRYGLPLAIAGGIFGLNTLV